MPRRYITAKEREAVRERAGGRCEYCLCSDEYSSQPFEMEHIIPVSLNGPTDLDNLAYACGGCNNFKYNRVEAVDPVENTLTALFNPRKDAWADHFTWSEDFDLIIGLTPNGRASIEALRLNRNGVVNIRKMLRLAGKHPPKV